MLCREPEAAKGWIALAAAKERIEAGEHVFWADFEDEARTVCRPRTGIGHRAEAIEKRFHFTGPSKIQTTFDVYGHLLPASHDEVRERMDAYLADGSESMEVLVEDVE